MHGHSVIVLSIAFILATLACLPQSLPSLLALISTIIGASAVNICQCFNFDSNITTLPEGLGITILIKMLLLMAVRSKFSGQTFYR